MNNPFITAVSDYHEFDEVVRHFKNANVPLNYIECGWNGPHNGYHAVFYSKKTYQTGKKNGRRIHQYV